MIGMRLFVPEYTANQGANDVDKSDWNKTDLLQKSVQKLR